MHFKDKTPGTNQPRANKVCWELFLEIIEDPTSMLS
jgi:hypothetical protein